MTRRAPSPDATLLRTTLASIGDGVIVTDADGRVTLLNPAAEAMTGWSAAEALGRPIDDVFVIVDEASGQPTPNPARKALAEGVVCGLPDRTTLIARDRRAIPIDDSAAPIRSPDGRVLGVVMVFRDITERRHAETERARLQEAAEVARAAAEAAERRASFLADASRVLASSLDYDATLERVARLAVPAICDLCVINLVTDDGRIRRAAAAYVDPEKERLLRELDARHPIDPHGPHPVASVLRTGRPQIAREISPALYETIVSGPEHAEVARQLEYRSYMVVPLIARDRTLGTLSLVSGPSGRRHGKEDVALAEDLARRAALAVDNARLYREAEASRRAAEAANRAKDDFLATLSHELRTPLTAILGWTRMLRSGVVGEANLRRTLEVIDRNATAQAHLIDDLLDISRIVSGKLQLSVRAVEIAPVVAAAIETVRTAAEAKRIRIEAALDPAAGTVTGDANRLQQVVWNLLANAVKFTPEGGHIDVGVECVNAAVRISVRDSGRGIAAELLPYVFDRFRQGAGAGGQGGLGLGLAIVRHIVELHGGTVEAESPGDGRGATFSVVLPRLASPWSEHVLPETRAQDLGDMAALDGIRVLVVDDEPDARDLFASVLGGRGAVVRSAGSAHEALEILESWRPDVLVTDLMMPGRDGHALLREVRARDNGGHVPAIALTAAATAAERSRAILAGFERYLLKPVDLGELCAVVATLAGRTSPA